MESKKLKSNEIVWDKSAALKRMLGNNKLQMKVVGLFHESSQDIVKEITNSTTIKSLKRLQSHAIV
jgi:hypothetical protein